MADPKPYRIIRTEEFAEDLRAEIRYSKSIWGADHARTYFQALRNSFTLLATSPHLHIHPAKGLVPGYGYYRFQGHLVLFSTDDKRRTVQLERLYGRNRFHELRDEMRQSG